MRCSAWDDAFVSSYRQDAVKRKLPVSNLLRPKIRFFAQQGRLVAPIHVKLGRANGQFALHSILPVTRNKSKNKKKKVILHCTTFTFWRCITE